MNLRAILHIIAISLMAFSFASCSNETKTTSKLLMDSELKTTHIETVVFGLGCFWGAEKRFSQLPGVVDVISGYADGVGVNADYKTITQRKNRFNSNNHAEVIQVSYNPDQVSLTVLLQDFFEQHDPTQLNQQGNDIGTQYRSIILVADQAQITLAENVAAQYQTLLTEAGLGQITTQIKLIDTFYPAEEYHQDYLVKNPNGYCPDHSTGVVFSPADKVEKKDNSPILTGQHIVVIDSEFCPYCDKFKSDVSNDYQGSIPMHFRRASQLDGLTITSPTWATPTILFMENGVEKFGIQGYVNATQFYKALGYFKLGNSEAFNVAFTEGTDSRFCKQYEIFKNTPDGLFIDKVSGAALFDTRDRFDSGTGWLSFTKAIDDSVYYKQDNRFGMKRLEIRAKKSDIHLGHKFNDGPNGQPRYCINATVLEFKARS
ncbi:peptide-methionine (S)-S-oxide reductase MsrA [Psychrosphaera sp. F3M07]|uniref:peptide-methionine (S)-S-oxide reductase MsrA n=1 Tax=Psychrosphaera sp. F3M07 TaxID=2841560 RepID=UPI001C09E767|nr:peptide-methionine (S)-S-oxide reductase MsrA [Psychrosphaera sp. F3M07]